MRRYKLANLLLQPDDFLENDTDLLYRPVAGARAYSVNNALYFSGEVDFCTYFNAASVAKWRRYANVVSVRLHIELAGAPCRIKTKGLVAVDDGGPLRTVAEGGALSDASLDYKVH